MAGNSKDSKILAYKDMINQLNEKSNPPAMLGRIE